MNSVAQTNRFTEQKAFIRSFIKRIMVAGDNVELIYNMPLPISENQTDKTGVLDTVQIGSPHWKHSELFFEKKELITGLQRLLSTFSGSKEQQ